MQIRAEVQQSTATTCLYVHPSPGVCRIICGGGILPSSQRLWAHLLFNGFRGMQTDSGVAV